MVKDLGEKLHNCQVGKPFLVSSPGHAVALSKITKHQFLLVNHDSHTLIEIKDGNLGGLMKQIRKASKNSGAIIISEFSKSICNFEREDSMDFNEMNIENISDYKTALHLAFRKGHANTVKDMINAIVQLKKNGKITGTQAVDFISSKHENGTPGFFLTLQNGHTNTAKVMIDAIYELKKQGVITQEDAFELISAKRSDGTSGVFMALQNDQTNLVKIMAEALPDLVNNEVITPEQALDVLLATNSEGLSGLL